VFIADFEKQFRFHAQNEFSPPDQFQKDKTRQYPSKSPRNPANARGPCK